MTNILPDQLLQCCPDDRAPDSPGVYAMEIDVPAQPPEVLESLWLDKYESLPEEYWHRIVDCDRHIYVGETGNVRARLNDHLNTGKRKATLPYVFGVNALIKVWWYDTKEAAEENEFNRAQELDDQTPASTFVHSR